jgi:hypothetical protein
VDWIALNAKHILLPGKIMMSSGQRWQKNGLCSIIPLLNRNILIVMAAELEKNYSSILQTCVKFVSVVWKKR